MNGTAQHNQWYAELLRRALAHTSDLGEAVAAAELAFLAQPGGVALAVAVSPEEEDDDEDPIGDVPDLSPEDEEILRRVWQDPNAAFGMVGDEWHGPVPPGPAWVQVGEGPHKGKIWKHKGGTGQQQEAPAPPTHGSTIQVEQPVRQEQPEQSPRPQPAQKPEPVSDEQWLADVKARVAALKAKKQEQKERPKRIPERVSKSDKFQWVQPPEGQKHPAVVMSEILGTQATEKDIRDMIGVKDGNVSVMTTWDDSGVRVFASTNKIAQMGRTIFKNHFGNVIVSNDSFFVHPEHQGGGYGTEVFTDEVRNAAAAGAVSIVTVGGKSRNRKDPMNGYYTWPLLGYDGDIPDSRRRALPPALKKSKPKTLQELYALPGGKEWWLLHGSQVQLHFDLREGSQSRQILDKYLAAKGRPGIGSTEERKARKKQEKIDAVPQEWQERLQKHMPPEEIQQLHAQVKQAYEENLRQRQLRPEAYGPAEPEDIYDGEYMHAILERRKRIDEAAKPTLSSEEDYKQNGTKAKAFKAWFGDWEADPANASKVVNTDGEPQETHIIPGDGSHVKDKEGRPIAVYHGTKTGGFQSFDKEKLKSSEDLLYGRGFYFTEDRDVAAEYAGESSVNISDKFSTPEEAKTWIEANREKRLRTLNPGTKLEVRRDARGNWRASAVSNIGKEAEVKDAYLNIRNPFNIDEKSPPSEIFGKLAEAVKPIKVDLAKIFAKKASEGTTYDDYGTLYRVLSQNIGKEKTNEILASAGYDGITHKGGGVMGDREHRVWIAFEPNQIKAVDNQGTFDPNDPRIAFSQTGVAMGLLSKVGGLFKKHPEAIGLPTRPVQQAPTGKIRHEAVERPDIGVQTHTLHENDQPVGIAHVRHDPITSQYIPHTSEKEFGVKVSGPINRIDNISIRPTHRGKGLGRVLYLHTMAANPHSWYHNSQTTDEAHRSLSKMHEEGLIEYHRAEPTHDMIGTPAHVKRITPKGLEYLRKLHEQEQA